MVFNNYDKKKKKQISIVHGLLIIIFVLISFISSCVTNDESISSRPTSSTSTTRQNQKATSALPAESNSSDQIGYNANLTVKSTDTGKSESKSIYRQEQSQKWYEGGTLHKKSALEWQSASDHDKLATCSDFVAGMWKEKSFVPKIQNSIDSVDSIKPYAKELVEFLDAATRKLEDPEQNRKMYANQTVSSMAVIGMISMGWLK